MGRTALHYAAGRRDGGQFYKLLTDAGAADDIKDLVRMHKIQILPSAEVLS